MNDEYDQLHQRIEEYLRDESAKARLLEEFDQQAVEWIRSLFQEWETWFDRAADTAGSGNDEFADKAERLLWLAHINDVGAGWGTAEFTRTRICLDKAQGALLDWGIYRPLSEGENADATFEDEPEIVPDEKKASAALERAHLLVQLALSCLLTLHLRAIHPS
jgi:hypothetical protein